MVELNIKNLSKSFGEKKIFENANDRSRTCAGSLDAPCPVSSGSCFSVFE